MANFLPEERVSAIVAAANAGQSLRAIAFSIGISKNTVKRYMPLATARASCPCGAPAGHKGWCDWRYAQSPARQAYVAGRTSKERVRKPRAVREPRRCDDCAEQITRRAKTGLCHPCYMARFNKRIRLYRPLLVYPYLPSRARPTSETQMLERVNAAVSSKLDPALRADICQDLLVALLSGEISVADLPSAAKKLTSRNRQMFQNEYGPLSLDAPIPDAGGLRLIDTLSEEDSIWRQAA